MAEIAHTRQLPLGLGAGRHLEEVLEHGVAILATGASPLEPQEYHYGEDPRIVTALEFDQYCLHLHRSLERFSWNPWKKSSSG